MQYFKGVNVFCSFKHQLHVLNNSANIIINISMLFYLNTKQIVLCHVPNIRWMLGIVIPFALVLLGCHLGLAQRLSSLIIWYQIPFLTHPSLFKGFETGATRLMHPGVSN